MLSALSRAVGTPAFSVSKLVFVFVEGQEDVGERARFRQLSGSPQNVRFLPVGSCDEVIRRVAGIRELANEAEAGMRLGGVVDRDFRTVAEAAALVAKEVFVLPVHEVENFYLHPPTLRILLNQHGLGDSVPEELIRNASDARAGSWIFQYAMATVNAKSLPDIPMAAKERAKALNWHNIHGGKEAAIHSIQALTQFAEDDARKFGRILEISVQAYERRREEDALWEQCEGKQVLNDVARASGFGSAAALVLACYATWELPDAAIPEKLTALRAYLGEL